MESNYPLVSLIITTYNREHLLKKAIESSIEQDYPNLEIIISDNCSTDGTESLVSNYLTDPRIKYFKNEQNLGMLGNFRKATYEYSKGSFITYVNSDDYLIDKSYVSDAVKLAMTDNEICIIWARMGVKNIDTGVVWTIPEEPYFSKEIWNGKDVFFRSTDTVLLSWGACMMRREYMLKVKTFHADFISFDLESNYKIILLGKAGFINRLCYIQIGHSDNAGFPVDSNKLIHNLECYDNVETFAISLLPDHKEKINAWKDHFVYSLIVWAFYMLSEKNEEEYILFKETIKSKYPKYYYRFINSTRFKRMQLVNIIKRVFPARYIRKINIWRNKYFRKRD
jgi:glycosyltransferase involved in cell wall biosynthesis